jgi:hypothetical protein
VAVVQSRIKARVTSGGPCPVLLNIPNHERALPQQKKHLSRTHFGDKLLALTVLQIVAPKRVCGNALVCVFFFCFFVFFLVRCLLVVSLFVARRICGINVKTTLAAQKLAPPQVLECLNA